MTIRQHPDCAVETVHFNAGPQHMDGATALIFARSREFADPLKGTNFARNKRQQLVLSAIKQKVLSVGGLGNLPNLLNSLGDHVKTDLPLGDALALYDLVKNVDTTGFEHVSIDNSNFIYDCGPPYGTASCPAAYEYPYDKSFATVQHFVQNIFPPQAALKEKAPVSVVDASGRNAGGSKRWSSLLADTGLAAADGTELSPTTHVIDTSGGRDAGTAQWLAHLFGVQVETPVPASPVAPASGSPASAPGGVTLVLGQDEERSFYGTGAGAYGTPSTGSSYGSPSGTAGSATPRRTTAPATAKPTAATAPAAPPTSHSTPGSLLDPPPLVTTTAAPAPGPSASSKPTPKPKPHHTPAPTPAPTP